MYENKANHNQSFLDSIIGDYPLEYFDWKVTIQFYIALHRCYCVLDASGHSICNRHKDNINNLKTIDAELGRNLFKLYNNSRQSRYDGFIHDDAMSRINKINFESNKSTLSSLNSKMANYYPAPIIAP